MDCPNGPNLVNAETAAELDPEAKHPASVAKPAGVGWSRDVARWFRYGLSVAGPFVCRCLTSLTVLRCHIPLIEPDGPISGIRLSEKESRVRPRKALRQFDQPN